MRRSSESGQVIVEQAIILPMMVFIILGILQLSMIAHARLCAEYAAYNAARSGIVYNGDVKRMERAAFLSLIPTYGRRVDNWGDLFRVFFSPAMAAQLGPDLADLLGIGILSAGKMVQVEIVDHPDPDITTRTGVMDQQGHLYNKQIDFDDFREREARANQLTVRVRYYYEMNVPFANWFLQLIWMAHRASAFTMAYRGSDVAFLAPEKIGGGSSHAYIKLQAAGMAAFDEPLAVSLAYRQLDQFRIPIETWYTMRMQSNLYRAYLP